MFLTWLLCFYLYYPYIRKLEFFTNTILYTINLSIHLTYTWMFLIRSRYFLLLFFIFMDYNVLFHELFIDNADPRVSTILWLSMFFKIMPSLLLVDIKRITVSSSISSDLLSKWRFFFKSYMPTMYTYNVDITTEATCTANSQSINIFLPQNWCTPKVPLKVVKLLEIIFSLSLISFSVIWITTPFSTMWQI